MLYFTGINVLRSDGRAVYRLDGPANNRGLIPPGDGSTGIKTEIRVVLGSLLHFHPQLTLEKLIDVRGIEDTIRRKMFHN